MRAAIEPPTWVAVAHARGNSLDLHGVLRPWSNRYRSSRVLLVEDGKPLCWLDFGPDPPTPEAVATARPPGLAPIQGPASDARLPSTTLVICTRGRRGTLERCLEGVAGAVDDDVEVIVVYNAPGAVSPAEAIERVSTDKLQVRWVVEPRRGLSIARNTGIEAATTEIVAFIDDDVIVDPGWLGPLRRAFAEDPKVGIVLGLVPPAELDTGAQIYFETRVPWSRSLVPRMFTMRNPGTSKPPFPYNAGQIGAGANMALRKDVVDRLGGFDTALGAGSLTLGGEDLEMYVRVLRAGYDIKFEPASIVWHVHASDSRALRRQLFGYGTGASAYLTSVLTRPSRGQVLKALPTLFSFAVETRQDSLASTHEVKSEALEAAGLLLGPVLYLVERFRRRIQRFAEQSLVGERADDDSLHARGEQLY